MSNTLIVHTYELTKETPRHSIWHRFMWDFTHTKCNKETTDTWITNPEVTEVKSLCLSCFGSVYAEQEYAVVAATLVKVRAR